MDPNANLKEQLELAEEIHAIWEECNDEGDLTRNQEGRVADAADKLAERVVALHEWITKGGFLPEAWRPAPQPVGLHQHTWAEIIPPPSEWSRANRVDCQEVSGDTYNAVMNELGQYKDLLDDIRVVSRIATITEKLVQIAYIHEYRKAADAPAITMRQLIDGVSRALLDNEA